MVEMQPTDDQEGTCSAAGFHAVGGWQHAVNGPTRGNPTLRAEHQPADCRNLDEIPEPDWASPAAKDLLPAVLKRRADHAAVVELVEKEAEKLRVQDLETAKLPNPLRKLQDRLRVAKECNAFHAALLVYVEKLIPDADERMQAAHAEVPPVEREIQEGLVELGFELGIDPRNFVRNKVLVAARNKASNCGYEKDRILRARDRCKNRIACIEGEIAYVEGEIRNALS